MLYVIGYDLHSELPVKHEKLKKVINVFFKANAHKLFDTTYLIKSAEGTKLIYNDIEIIIESLDIEKYHLFVGAVEDDSLYHLNNESETWLKNNGYYGHEGPPKKGRKANDSNPESN